MKPDDLKRRFRGLQVVLITPMSEDFSVDLKGLEDNVRTVLAHGVDGLVVSGTYGEFSTLSADERTDMFRVVASAADGVVPVVACVAHSATREVISLAERAVRAGVDGVLVAPPFLCEANADQIVGHFQCVASAVDTGVLVYNDPDLGVYLDVALLDRIADEVPNVCGTKHGATDLRELYRLVDGLGDRWTLVGGSDTLAIASHAVGFNGITSSRTGPFPELIPKIWRCLEANDLDGARRLQAAWRGYRELSSKFGEPATMKAAHELRGRPGGPVRPPLQPLGKDERGELAGVVEQITAFIDTLEENP